MNTLSDPAPPPVIPPKQAATPRYASPSRGLDALGCCPNCGSDDLRKVSVVYEAGTSHINTSTKGVGVGLAGGELGVGGISAETSGLKQTHLSARLSPPIKRKEESNLASGCGCFALLGATMLIGAIAGEGPGLLALVAATVAWMVALLNGVFSRQEDVEWNANRLPTLRANWERSVVCMRCGAVTDLALPA